MRGRGRRYIDHWERELDECGNGFFLPTRPEIGHESLDGEPGRFHPIDAAGRKNCTRYAAIIGPL